MNDALPLELLHGLPRPWVMGILNVTPDSFSDGGAFADRDAACAHAARMIAEGAAIIDVGPESTRPGAMEVPADEQIRRAVPVVEAIRAAHPRVVISIDTRLASVARAALAAGADIINDVSALRDDAAMVEAAAATGATVILMHRRGTSRTMQEGGGPHYDDVIGEICAFLRARMAFAESGGVRRAQWWIDPGLGFGKRVEHNVAILRHLDRFVALGAPVVVGASRKRFVGAVVGEGNPSVADAPRERLAGTLACATIAALAGAAVIRAHDVRATVDAVRMCAAVRAAGS